MSSGSLIIQAREWIGAALGLFACGVLLAVVQYGFGGRALSKGRRQLAALAKIAGFGILAFCLVNPVWTELRAKPGVNLFALAADNSESLRIHDRAATSSRGEALQKLLRGESPWQARIEENFQLRRYFFDTRLHNTRDFSELDFTGRATSLQHALRGVIERNSGQPLGGIILFTDGNATDWDGVALDTSGWPPIYPVVLGGDSPPQDVAVQRVVTTQTEFEDAPVTLTADIQTSGFAGTPITAELWTVPRNDGPTNQNAVETKVSSQTQTPSAADEKLVFRFETKPDKAGLNFYMVRAAATAQLTQFTKPSDSTEATLANNTRIVAVDRGQGPHRILYVSGRPNWEFKFLNRAVADDDQVQLTGLIRIARREPKFSFRGRAGESSNPLFRGFDGKDDETARYDQPVLVRLNTRDDVELRDGFPKKAGDLFGFEAVILDDIEADFFSPDQMQLLRRFVSERGGSLLMLGGPDSLSRGKYQRTPVGDMLPVYLDGVTQIKPTGKVRLELSREGWLEPWVRLRGTENEERARLSAAPPFQVLSEVRDTKPGASVLAYAVDARQTKHPALVTQRFGKGRAACLMLGDLWRSGLGTESGQKDLQKSWRQTCRWLTTGAMKKIEAEVVPEASEGELTSRLQIRVRDSQFEPQENAVVQITVRPVGSSINPPVTLPAEPVVTEPGLYTAVYLPREPGGYAATVRVTDASGLSLGETSAGWSSNPQSEEFSSLSPNRAALEMLARQTGGEIIRAENLDAFAATLQTRKAPVMEAASEQFWHRPLFLAVALACFAIEWGLRRRAGLP